MKKLFTSVSIIILFIFFAYACFYIFNDEKMYEQKIIDVKNNLITLEDGKKLNISKDTVVSLFGDEVDFDYLKNHYFAYKAEITARDDEIVKINLTNDVNKITIVAFIKKDAMEDEVQQVKQTLEIVNHVLSVKYITSEEAKEEMSNRGNVFKDILNKLDENPLSSYLLIEVDGNINQIVRYLTNSNVCSVIKY